MAVFIIAWQDMKRALRDPMGLVMTLAVPLALIVAIGLVSGNTPFGAPPADGVDALSYIAPGMALFFLMMSVRQAARTIAEDTDRGVRNRLRSAPVAETSVTAGGMASHVALFFLQLVVLIGISSRIYGLSWGSPGPLLLVCLVLAITASGWAALLVSIGRTPGRINALGMALTLAFGIMSRSFAATIPTTQWMDSLARVTPNYWGQHAFLDLALGGGLGSVGHDLLALTVMSAALWAAAAMATRFASHTRR